MKRRAFLKQSTILLAGVASGIGLSSGIGDTTQRSVLRIAPQINPEWVDAPYEVVFLLYSGGGVTHKWNGPPSYVPADIPARRFTSLLMREVFPDEFAL